MIKVLVLTGGLSVDYLSDMVWINLATDTRINFFSNIYPSFFFSKNNLNLAWGKGFTLYGKLDKDLIKSSPSQEELIYMIRSGYYDFIIYSSIRRFSKFFDIAIDSIGGDKVIAIDGEDDKTLSYHAESCTYFKRELIGLAYSYGVKPISFFLPNIIITDIRKKIHNNFEKSSLLAPCDPRDKSTYIYKNETDYYNQYSQAFFGFTQRKAGWDCLRHYEIIASGCLPYFDRFEYLPDYTLRNYPRDLQIRSNKLYIKLLADDLMVNELNQEYEYLKEEFFVWLKESARHYGSKELSNLLFSKDKIPNYRISLRKRVLSNAFACYLYQSETKLKYNYMKYIHPLLFTIKDLIRYFIYLPLKKYLFKL